MPIYVKTSSQSNPAPAGTHLARCYSVLDVGTHTSKGQFAKTQRRIVLQFELPNELHRFKEDEPEKPFSITREFAQSTHEKAGLRIFLEGWVGRKFTDEELKRFDVSKFLGRAAMLNVIHDSSGERTYANIASISPLPKGMACPAAINEPVELSLEQEDFDPKAFAKVQEWLQKRITESPEYKALGLGDPGNNSSGDDGFGLEDSDIPF